MIFPQMSQRTWDELSEAESTAPEVLRELGDFLSGFVAELTETGELIETGGFAAPADLRTVVLRDGASSVADGVGSATEEVPGGYFMVSCADLARATEIAARLNRAPGPVPRSGIVVRRLLEDEQ